MRVRSKGSTRRLGAFGLGQPLMGAGAATSRERSRAESMTASRSRYLMPESDEPSACDGLEARPVAPAGGTVLSTTSETQVKRFASKVLSGAILSSAVACTGGVVIDSGNENARVPYATVTWGTNNTLDGQTWVVQTDS